LGKIRIIENQRNRTIKIPVKILMNTRIILLRIKKKKMSTEKETKPESAETEEPKAEAGEPGETGEPGEAGEPGETGEVEEVRQHTIHVYKL
jgi:hypothetical protein